MKDNYIQDTIGKDYVSNEMDFEEFCKWSDSIKKQMKDAVETYKFHNVSVTLESTREPYEDYLGPVEVVLRGYRPKNRVELAREEQDKRIDDFAKKLGVSYYEASTILSLKERGKL
jgi:uncharacterized protein YeeX (DUF496 family)